MSDRYTHLGNGSGPVRDLTAIWDGLRPIGEVAEARDAIEQFCSRKRIEFASLEALGTRVRRDHDVGYLLAYAGSNGNGTITAIKYRPVGGTSHDGTSEHGSRWLRPIVVGKLDSLDWVVTEGETDGARLHGLVGDSSAILVLPTGALTFDRAWADLIPRGATVALALDADKDGDTGAVKATEIVGGRTVRVRPPVEGTDWCDWDGSREEFAALAKPVPRYEFLSHVEFVAREFPKAEPLLGEPKRLFLAVGSLFMVYGAEGSAKSTWTVDGTVHLAAGADWLGIPVPRPVRCCIIENEGPPSLFQQKILDRVDSWEGPDPMPNLFYYVRPWGEFSFADPDGRAALNEYCDEHRIDVVMANPTLGLGVGASGKPNETQQFVDWLVECGLKTTRAFWPIHHENKAGQISGDWGRHPDTKVLLQRDGDAQRTKLTWDKTRWATLGQEDKLMLLEWVTESQSYRVIAKAATASDDADLDRRIQAFLVKNPASAGNVVRARVTGEAKRITARLKAAFHYVEGKNRAQLWMPRSDELWPDDDDSGVS